MKPPLYRALCLLFALFFQVFSYAQKTNSSHVSVSGYYKSNGTYVEPHYRTAPNSTNVDNFSTLGNTNPYTGQAGWVLPDNKSVPSSSYNAFEQYNSKKTIVDSRMNSLDSYGLDNTANTNTTEYDKIFASIKAVNMSNSVRKAREAIDYHDRYSWGDKRAIEYALDKIGYNIGSIDGIFDENTIDGIVEFQRDHFLNPDGKAGNMTCQNIIAAYRN